MNYAFIVAAWTSALYANDTAMNRLDVPWDEGAGLAVSVQSMGHVSYQKVYRQVQRFGDNFTRAVTYPLLLAVISVSKGHVVVSWSSLRQTHL